MLPAQCNRIGCENVGLWRPVLILRPPVAACRHHGCDPGSHAMVKVRLALCTAHRTFDAQKFLTSSAGAVVSAAFSALGYEPPDYAQTTVTWEDVKHPFDSPFHSPDLPN